jgi:hypothetical protein
VADRRAELTGALPEVKLRPATIALSFLLLMFTPCPALRAQATDITPQEQARLAEQFAPVLVFHADERYFPTNPLFPIEFPVRGTDPGFPLARLGTPETRTASYEALTLAEKAKIATVYYRAYFAQSSDKSVIVLEYWFYYVRNEYRVRGNVLPLWLSGSHPNDLEHIHLVIRADSGKYVVDTVYASAHEGKIPANRYRYKDTIHEGPTRFLVEQGSHALAPDIDEDGIFTVGTDGDSGSKILWGIRDHGYTWPRYRNGYMDPRVHGKAIVLAHGKAAASLDQGPQFSYQLAPVESISEGFVQLSLTDNQRKGAFENETFWFTRVFGRDNGRADELIVPRRAKSDGKSVGVRGVSSSERRLFVGSVLNADSQGLFIGGRYSYLTSSMYLPDLLFQVDGIVTQNDKYLSPQFLLSYPLDGFTRIMGGRALVPDSLRFSRRQWDTVGTIEVRLGDMRISATTRSTGPIRGAAKEFRLFYAF